MKNDNLIDLLFDKQEDEDIFNFKDKLLEEFDNKIDSYDDRLNYFIDKKVHPANRKLLRNLLKTKENYVNRYNRRENQLYYKNGVSDGARLMLMLLTFK